MGGVGGAGGIPSGASGISGNLTLVDPSSAGWGFVGPSITSTPKSSTLNAVAHQTVAIGFDVALGSNKLAIVWVGTTGSSANFSLDVTGYWR